MPPGTRCDPNAWGRPTCLAPWVAVVVLNARHRCLTAILASSRLPCIPSLKQHNNFYGRALRNRPIRHCLRCACSLTPLCPLLAHPHSCNPAGGNSTTRPLAPHAGPKTWRSSDRKAGLSIGHGCRRVCMELRTFQLASRRQLHTTSHATPMLWLPRAPRLPRTLRTPLPAPTRHCPAPRTHTSSC